MCENIGDLDQAHFSPKENQEVTVTLSTQRRFLHTLSGKVIREPLDSAGLSLRTNGEAVGTGVLCGSTATFGLDVEKGCILSAAKDLRWDANRHSRSEGCSPEAAAV